MNLSDFHYDLPPGQIAQEPVSPRDHARLLCIDAATDGLQHRRFHELDQILRPGDLLVTNATKVFPARLRGRKSTGGKAEVLLLAPLGDARTWRALVRGARKPVALEFTDGLTASMGDELPNGEWVVRFSSDDVRTHLERHGEMPLPPYIKRETPRTDDLTRYQTVFAKQEGAVAAPTAGFHFTPELLERLAARGVERAEIVLHVGWGTFRPVRTERIEDHQMLDERYEISAAAADAVNRAKAEGRRVVAVGTTVVRTLETLGREAGPLRQAEGHSGLFIYPGFRFHVIDALITNFHLPDSTPLLLACAFYEHRRTSQGLPVSSPFTLRGAYQEAIQKGYRFYSYGDATFIQ